MNKVFKMNDWDSVAANSLEEAKTWYTKETGDDELDGAYEIDIDRNKMYCLESEIEQLGIDTSKLERTSNDYEVFVKVPYELALRAERAKSHKEPFIISTIEY
ncbi:hypothetical protein ACIQFL_28610 [Bacillus toyonensis]|uniref:hypothetical protein n=1 Tax=Bacillus toyonensis TaxID=155322 RepID=UPI0037F8640F